VDNLNVVRRFFSILGSPQESDRPLDRRIIAHLLISVALPNRDGRRCAWEFVEAVNGISSCLIRRGRGYQNLRYLLLKAQRMAATKTEFVVFRKAA
jgi:hypothetical protein